mgnify:CR=1 FL=1
MSYPEAYDEKYKRWSLDTIPFIPETFKYEVIENVDFNKELIGKIERSDAGGIKSISIGDVTIKGTTFRNIFGLRSTNIIINITGDAVNFDVTGYGHGVGMSQYGANHLANQGKSYIEILKTYYQGVEIE